MSPALCLMPPLPDVRPEPQQLLLSRAAFSTLLRHPPAVTWRLCGKEPPARPPRCPTMPRRYPLSAVRWRDPAPEWAHDLDVRPVAEVRALVPAPPANEVVTDEPLIAPARARQKSLTIRAKPLSALERETRRLRILDNLPPRPIAGGRCANAIRPCPYASCSMHLGVDVTDSGSLKLNFPHLEVWEMRDTCALDVATDGPHTHERIAEAFNVSSQRAVQMVHSAMLEFAAKLDAHGLPWPEDVMGPRPAEDDEVEIEDEPEDEN